MKVVRCGWTGLCLKTEVIGYVDAEDVGVTKKNKGVLSSQWSE